MILGYGGTLADLRGIESSVASWLSLLGSLCRQEMPFNIECSTPHWSWTHFWYYHKYSSFKSLILKSFRNINTENLVSYDKLM